MTLTKDSNPHLRLYCGVMALGLLASVILSACAAPSNGIGGSGEVDSSFSDLAIGSIVGSAGTGDAVSGVALLNSRKAQTWVERVAKFIAIEREAQAASVTCITAASWGTAGATTIQFNPATGCTISYANGATGSYSVTGSWTFTFAGAGSSVLQGGAVSNNPTGTTVGRSTTSGILIRSYTGPLGNTYSVTEDTATCTPYTGSVTCGGDLTTCGTPACPHGIGAFANGGRSVVLQGMQVMGTKDSNTFYNHTVASTVPLMITGFGPNRVISSGAVVVYHNIAQIMTTTTVTAPLTHEAGCAFPVSGSVTTMITGGPLDGTSETVTFTNACGMANLVNPDGSTSQLQLHTVL